MYPIYIIYRKGIIYEVTTIPKECPAGILLYDGLRIFKHGGRKEHGHKIGDV